MSQSATPTLQAQTNVFENGKALLKFITENNDRKVHVKTYVAEMAHSRATQLGLSCSVNVDTLRQRLETFKFQYTKTVRRKSAMQSAPQKGILLDTHVFHLTSWQPKAPIASKVPTEKENVPPPGESIMGRRKRPLEVLQGETNSRNMVKNMRREKTILRAKLNTQRCLLEEINQDHQQMDSIKHELEASKDKEAKLQDLLQSMSLDMEAKTRECTLIQQESDQLRARIDALQSRNASLATQLEESHSEVEELSLQLEDTKHELQKTQTCLLTAETQAQVMVETTDDLEKNNKELQSNLQQMREDNRSRSDVERCMKELFSSMEDLSQERQTLEENNAKLQSDLRHMRQQHRYVLEEKERRLKDLSKEVEDLIQERNGLRIQLDKTVAKAQDLHQKHRAASKNLSRTRLAKRKLESCQPPKAPEYPPVQSPEAARPSFVTTYPDTDPPQLQVQQPRASGGLEYTAEVCFTVMALIQIGVPASVAGLAMKVVLMFLRVAILTNVPSVSTSTRIMRAMAPLSDAMGAMKWMERGVNAFRVAGDCTTHKGTHFSATTLYIKKQDGSGTLVHSLGALPVQNEKASTIVTSLARQLENLTQAAAAVTGEVPDFMNLAGGSDGSGGCCATQSDHAAAAQSATAKAIEAEQMRVLEAMDPDIRPPKVVTFGCHAHKVDNAMKAIHSAINTFQWPPDSVPIPLPNQAQVREDQGASATGGAMKAAYLVSGLLAPSDSQGQQWLAGHFKAMQLLSDVSTAIPHESKARFLEQAHACAVVTSERGRILTFLGQLCEKDRSNIVSNVISALNDKPTAIQFIVYGLWYFR
eukprot:jgi/Botrbrau1/16547/Bobra.0256s0006.1